MKKIKSFLFAFSLLLLSTFVKGQDLIYLVDHSSVPAEITEINKKMVCYRAAGDVNGKIKSFPAKQVLLVFKRNGDFIVMSDLKDASMDANNLINAFMTPRPVSSYTYDKIITMGNNILPGNFEKEENNFIYYRRPDGVVDKVFYNDASMILFKDGRHKLFVLPPIAATTLSKIRDKVRKMNNW